VAPTCANAEAALDRLEEATLAEIRSKLSGPEVAAVAGPAVKESVRMVRARVSVFMVDPLVAWDKPTADQSSIKIDKNIRK
jgi:hypothetical protein